MKTFLAIIVGLLMLGTVGVLFAGLFGLIHGGGDPARSNRLMRYRVIAQAIAVLIIMTVLYLSSQH